MYRNSIVRKIGKKSLEDIVANSENIKDVCLAVGYKQDDGKTRDRVKKRLDFFNISYTHLKKVPLVGSNYDKYQSKYYAKNKQYYKEKARRRKIEIRSWYRNYKSKLSCGNCPETHTACLVFHHRDPKQKDIEVSIMVLRGYGKERILKEINKCDVLCRNCHAKHHYKGEVM